MAKLDFFAYGLKPMNSFEQLVVGANNQFAVSACLAVAKNLGETYNPLFVYGPPGVGKTHLVQAVAQVVLRKNPELKVRYISAERFMSEVIAAISENNLLSARQHFSDFNLLILDDVQYLAQSQSSQEELSHIFNNMQQANYQLILACDRPPNQLSGLNKTLRSRLEGGLATDVKLPDIDTRIEILKKKQEAQEIHIPDDQLVYVAQHLRSNVRELEGFVKRIHAYVMLSHQELSAKLVESVVREVLPAGATDIPSNDLEQPSNGAVPAATPVSVPPPPPTPAAAPSPTKIEVIMPPMPKAPVLEEPPVLLSLDRESIPAPAAHVLAVPVQANAEIKNGNGVHKKHHKENGSAQPNPSPEDEVMPRPIEAAMFSPPPPAFELLSNDSMSNDLDVPVSKPRHPVHVKPPVAEPPAEVKEEKPVEPELAPTPEEKKEPDVLDPALLGLKEIGAVFFYPQNMEKALESVHQKFQDVIKKHKLKFRLKRIHSEPYQSQGKTNYSSFVDVCKRCKVPVAVVIGPPPEAHIPEHDFYDLLSVTLDVQGVSLQLINWTEIDKDYRYLNLALDIALVRSR